MMLSILIGIEDIGPLGRFIFFTILSQKHRGQSSSKLRLDGDSLYSIFFSSLLPNKYLHIYILSSQLNESIINTVKVPHSYSSRRFRYEGDNLYSILISPLHYILGGISFEFMIENLQSSQIPSGLSVSFSLHSLHNMLLT